MDEGVFHYDFVSQEDRNFAEISSRGEPVKIQFEFESWQKDLFNSQFEVYGTSDQGLGKIIARSPIKHTYRKATVVGEMASSEKNVALG